MRTAQADYTAINNALHQHQRRTLDEYAKARGAPKWRDEPAACAVAVTLAVENTLSTLRENGVDEKVALLRVAAEFDIDIGTLRRQRRRARRRIILPAR